MQEVVETSFLNIEKNSVLEEFVKQVVNTCFHEEIFI